MTVSENASMSVTSEFKGLVQQRDEALRDYLQSHHLAERNRAEAERFRELAKQAKTSGNTGKADQLMQDAQKHEALQQQAESKQRQHQATYEAKERSVTVAIANAPQRANFSNRQRVDAYLDTLGVTKTDHTRQSMQTIHDYCQRNFSDQSPVTQAHRIGNATDLSDPLGARIEKSETERFAYRYQTTDRKAGVVFMSENGVPQDRLGIVHLDERHRDKFLIPAQTEVLVTKTKSVKDTWSDRDSAKPFQDPHVDARGGGNQIIAPRNRVFSEHQLRPALTNNSKPMETKLAELERHQNAKPNPTPEVNRRGQSVANHTPKPTTTELPRAASQSSTRTAPKVTAAAPTRVATPSKQR